MRAQKRAFWITFLSSIVFFGTTIICFYLLTKDTITNELIKACLVGLFTGFVISFIMAWVFHTNEKHKFLKELFDRSNSMYFFLYNSSKIIDDCLTLYENKNKHYMFSCVDSCRNILDLAFKNNKEKIQYLEELRLLFSRGKKLKKFEKVVKGVLDGLNNIHHLFPSCQQIINNSNNKSKYKDDKAKSDYLFLAMYKLKDEIDNTLNFINNGMLNLQTLYHFDIRWENAVIEIANRQKFDIEKSKSENRQDIISEINARQSIESLLNSIKDFVTENANNSSELNNFGNAIQDIITEGFNDTKNKKYTTSPKEKKINKKEETKL